MYFLAPPCLTNWVFSFLTQYLTPGDYQLFIVELTATRDRAVTNRLTCQPFSLSLSLTRTDRDETPLNCDVPHIPTDLNAPGYLNDMGQLLFSRDVLLNVSQSLTSIRVQVTRPSLLRIHAYNSRVDVDLALRRLGATTDLAIASKGRPVDALTYNLEPNVAYNVSVKLFGRYAALFCETFHLQIAIAPLPSFDFCAAASLPNTSTIELGRLLQPSIANRTTSQFVYRYEPNSYSLAVAATYQFAVTAPMRIRVDVGMNFLLGDFELVLLGEDRVVASHSYNSLMLAEELEEGNYTLTLTTGALQGTTMGQAWNFAANLPPCAVLSISAALEPADTPTPCWAERSLPASLNAPGLLYAPQQYLQLAEQYLIPALRFGAATQETLFRVTEPALLRAYIPSDSRLDLDLMLYEDQVRVKTSTFLRPKAEEVMHELQPGKQYSLRVRFGEALGQLEDCALWSLQLSITPAPPSLNCTVSLPPVDTLSKLDWTKDIVLQETYTIWQEEVSGPDACVVYL